jgi:hypothetical protein
LLQSKALSCGSFSTSLDFTGPCSTASVMPHAAA